LACDRLGFTAAVAHPYTPYCPTFHYTGRYSYLLTFVTFERTQAFTDPIRVGIARPNILRAAIEQRFEIVVYCFMPDHAHLIVEGLADDSDLKKFVKLAKQYSGYYYARACGGRRLWQHGKNDRIIRDRVDLLDRLRYVVNNPVAAGLVARPEDYPFLGSQRWTVEEMISRLKAGAI
jgi:putative transposase